MNWGNSALGIGPLGLQPPRPATGVIRALRAGSVSGVSPRVSPKTGVSEGGVRRGVPGPLWTRAPECPKSVPRVSPECQKGVWTLRGHSRDTFWTLRTPVIAPGRPHRTLPQTPPFSGTPSGTLPRHFGPEGTEDSCSRSGGGCNTRVEWRSVLRVQQNSFQLFCPPALGRDTLCWWGKHVGHSGQEGFSEIPLASELD